MCLVQEGQERRGRRAGSGCPKRSAQQSPSDRADATNPSGGSYPIGIGNRRPALLPLGVPHCPSGRYVQGSERERVDATHGNQAATSGSRGVLYSTPRVPVVRGSRALCALIHVTGLGAVPTGADVPQKWNSDSEVSNTCIISGVEDLIEGMSWARVVELQEELDDAPYIRMSDAEFRAAKESAKRSRKFSSWDLWLSWAKRIEGKRRIAAQPQPQPRERDEVTVLLALRADYQRFPQVYFRNEAEQTSALYKLEEQIRKLPGGRWRMDLVVSAEAAEAAAAIDAVIARVRRGAEALRKCRRTLAMLKIKKFMLQAHKTIQDFFDDDDESYDPHEDDYEEEHSGPCRMCGRDISMSDWASYGYCSRWCAQDEERRRDRW